MKIKQTFCTLSVAFIGSHSYSVGPKPVSFVDDFKNTRVGYEPLPNESNPIMHRTILENTFEGYSTDNPKLNIVTNRILQRRHLNELRNASFVLKYDFDKPLYANKNSYVNFYFDSVKQPFRLELSVDKNYKIFNISPINCTTDQNHYSVPMNPFSYSNRGEKINGVDIKFIAGDAAFQGSMAILDSIELGAEPVPEPISILTMGGGVFAFVRRRNQKRSCKFS